MSVVDIIISFCVLGCKDGVVVSSHRQRVLEDSWVIASVCWKTLRHRQRELEDCGLIIISV